MEKQYKVLIVEDETLIAQGLKYMTEHAGLPCEVTGVADDGIQGYEMARQLKPDIVITDICMPGMNGLAMIEALKREGCKAEFLILSGYGEFEYARRAIELGVKRYVLKPVDKLEFGSMLAEICREMTRRQDRDRNIRDKLEGFSRNVREHICREILNTPEYDAGNVLQMAGREGQIFPKACYGVSLWEETSGKSDFLSVLEERLKKRLNSDENQTEIIPVRLNHERAAVILGVEDCPQREEFLEQLAAVCREVTAFGGFSMAAGIGTFYRSMERIRRSYEEADCALRYRQLNQEKQVTGYEETGNLQAVANLISEEKLKWLEEAMEKMDKAELRKGVYEIFDELERRGDLTASQLQNISLNLILLGIRKTPYLQFQLSEYLGKDILTLESVSHLKNVEQMRNSVLNLLLSMTDVMRKSAVTDSRNVIEDVKLYINRHFHEEITLREISDRFYINPYYFSQLFKKKEGMTYVNYLTRVRITRAKKLLEETELRVYEICNMVGYNDVSYFSRIFEKQEGVKPLEYRAGRKER